MKAFISYSHKDAWALDRLHTHLAMLRHEGKIKTWYDRKILAGGDIDQEISKQLETCDLFLPLISQYFLDSDYCYDQEMTQALKRLDAGEVHVIPIIIEPCDWKNSPLNRLKALPRDGKPVTEWTNQNAAFTDIVAELRRILTEGDTKGDTAVVTPSTGQLLRQVDKLKIGSDDTAVVTPSTGQTREGRKYRIKRSFNQIERSDFREQAFETIRTYFEAAIDEIDSIKGVQGRFRAISSQSFSCTVINQNIDRGTAHITVHAGNDLVNIGSIYYSFSENAPSNTANGWFRIESDEYDLFLQNAMDMPGSRNDARLSAQEAAELLWTQFIEQAGMSLD